MKIFNSFYVKSDDVEAYMSTDDNTGILIRNEYTQQYILFETPHEYNEFFKKQTYPMLHEVIPWFVKQKPRWDIDILYNDMALMFGSVTEVCAKYIKYNFMDCVLECLCEHGIMPSNILSAQSHRPGKYSYHIWINGYYVENNKIMRLLDNELKLIIKTRAPKILRFVDWCHKKVQNLRSVGSHKLVDKQYHKLKMEGNGHKLTDTLLTHISVTDEKINIIVPPEEIINDLNKLKSTDDIEHLVKTGVDIIAEHCIIDLLDNFMMRNISVMGLICICNFIRLQESYCSLCSRFHARDNSLYLLFKNNDVYECCYKNKGKRRFICKIDIGIRKKLFITDADIIDLDDEEDNDQLDEFI